MAREPIGSMVENIPSQLDEEELAAEVEVEMPDSLDMGPIPEMLSLTVWSYLDLAMKNDHNRSGARAVSRTPCLPNPPHSSKPKPSMSCCHPLDPCELPCLGRALLKKKTKPSE